MFGPLPLTVTLGIMMIREKMYRDGKVLEPLYLFQFYENKILNSHNVEMNHGNIYIQFVLGL
jgi:hypothetical protein